MENRRKYSSEWIHHLETREGWLSYWHQIKLMHSIVRKGDSMVEIGIGTGFTSNYWRSKGVNVLTVDIDKEKSPDIVLDAIEFTPKISFDHLCVFELFEHMRFEELGFVLDNVKNFINKNIFISVPVFKKTPLALELKVKSFWKSFSIPFPKIIISDPHHKWELGYKNYTEKRFINEFKNREFVLDNKLCYLRWRYFNFKNILDSS